MRRWIFLLAFPYVVNVSTHSMEIGCYPLESLRCLTSFTSTALMGPRGKIEEAEFSNEDLSNINSKKEYLEDLAEALNEAHRNREQALSPHAICTSEDAKRL